MRSHDAVVLSSASSTRQYLFINGTVWLILNGHVAAVYMEEVYFPDQPFTRAQMAAINEFKSQVAHTRVPLSDWDYYVASSGMRGLRPLLGKPQTEEQTDARNE